MYSDIERNDTRNFREKKIFRVALSGTLEVERVNHILYIVCLYIIYSCIIYIYNMLFCFSSFSLMFFMVSIFCGRLPAVFCIWYQKVALQNLSSGIIRYHFIMLYTPISTGTRKRMVSIPFPLVYQKSIGTKTQLFKICFF